MYTPRGKPPKTSEQSAHCSPSRRSERLCRCESGEACGTFSPRKENKGPQKSVFSCSAEDTDRRSGQVKGHEKVTWVSPAVRPKRTYVCVDAKPAGWHRRGLTQETGLALKRRGTTSQFDAPVPPKQRVGHANGRSNTLGHITF